MRRWSRAAWICWILRGAGLDPGEARQQQAPVALGPRLQGDDEGLGQLGLGLEDLGERRLAPLDQRLQPGEGAVQDQLALEVEQAKDPRIARRRENVGDHVSLVVLCLRMSKMRSARPTPPRSDRRRAYCSVSRLEKACSPAPPPKPAGMAFSPVYCSISVRKLASNDFGGRPDVGVAARRRPCPQLRLDGAGLRAVAPA